MVFGPCDRPRLIFERAALTECIETLSFSVRQTEILAKYRIVVIELYWISEVQDKLGIFALSVVNLYFLSVFYAFLNQLFIAVGCHAIQTRIVIIVDCIYKLLQMRGPQVIWPEISTIPNFKKLKRLIK